MKTYLCILTLLTVLLLAPLAALHAAAAPKPNIVLILADDLGTGHVGWQNPKVKTPHLDRLAKAGVQLRGYPETDIAVSPVFAHVLRILPFAKECARCRTKHGSRIPRT